MLRILFTQYVALVVKYITVWFAARDILDYYLELEIALDTLKRKVSLLDSLSGFFHHVVVVVIYALPEFGRFIGFLFLLIHIFVEKGALVIKVGVDQGADAGGYGDLVEDGTGENVVLIERNNRVYAPAGAISECHNLYYLSLAINLNY